MLPLKKNLEKQKYGERFLIFKFTFLKEVKMALI